MGQTFGPHGVLRIAVAEREDGVGQTFTSAARRRGNANQDRAVGATFEHPRVPIRILVETYHGCCKKGDAEAGSGRGGVNYSQVNLADISIVTTFAHRSQSARCGFFRSSGRERTKPQPVADLRRYDRAADPVPNPAGYLHVEQAPLRFEPTARRVAVHFAAAADDPMTWNDQRTPIRSHDVADGPRGLWET